MRLKDSMSNTEVTDTLEPHQDSTLQHQDNENDEISASVAEQSEVQHILEKLEPEEKQLISTMISYSGPLPPPEYLKGYAEVYPEAPLKIFGWVEEQQNHRHEMERNHMNKSFRYSLFGLIGGFVLSLVFIIGGFILIMMDKEVLGISLMAPFIITLATLLITQNRKNKKSTSESNSTEEDESETEQ